MTGLLLWKRPDRPRISSRVCVILQTRFFMMEISRGNHTPQWLLRRRVRIAAQTLAHMGAETVITPTDFADWKLFDILRPYSTLSLRRAIAGQWVQAALAERGQIGVQIGVYARRLTGEVVRTVTELSLRHRYVMLDTPYGGEELRHKLRRKYGVSLLLIPVHEQMQTAEALLLFDDMDDVINGMTDTPEITADGLETVVSGMKSRSSPEHPTEQPIILRLYDETQPLPKLLLPAALDQAIPPGVMRDRFLAALLDNGALRGNQIAIDPIGKAYVSMESLADRGD